jgi:hypothetical protein
MIKSYAEAIIGIPLTDIKLEDLNQFFSIEQEETDLLELKSYFEKNQSLHTHKENGILKTICAFLNSSGGLLIWGAPVGKSIEGRKHKIFTGQLSPVEQLIENDTFISKIANNIIPLSSNVRMCKIEVEDGKYVYLFDVGQSDYKPHQFDNRFWVRLYGQTGIAPYYLIDALFKQIQTPEIRGYVRIIGYNCTPELLINLTFSITIFNISKTINDQDTYFSLVTSAGEFKPNELENYFFNGNNVLVRNIVPVITYGLPFNADLKLQFFASDLRKNNGFLKIELFFGSRTSPTKTSSYQIDLIDINPYFANQILTHTSSLNSVIKILKEENLLSTETWKGSEEDRIDKTLKGI